MKRSFIREILESIDSETISFAGGLPNGKLFPKQQLQKAAMKILKNEKSYQYGLSGGVKELKKQILKNYNDNGFKTQRDNILITSGSQQGLYILSKYFTGKDIIIESPSYLGAVKVFKSQSLKMKAIELKNDGIKINQFKEQYKKTKLAYLIPDFQNPKGTLYSKIKREKIAKIVQQNGGFIIEDAPYSELFFKKKKDAISRYIPDNSFHLGSFSKTISPSLRIGWIRASKNIINELLSIKEEIDLHSCGVSQYILAEYLQDTKAYSIHLKRLREEYKNKMEFFSKTLKKELPQFRFSKPKGGMFIYGKLEGIDTKELLTKALKKKIVYVPGDQFYIDAEKSDEIRFNFTNATKKEIKEGVKRLKSILKDKNK